MTEWTTDLPTLNVDLLVDLLKWAGQEELHLEKVYAKRGWPAWYQAAWVASANGGEATVCGSKACIAGNAVIQSGEWIPAPLFVDITKKPDDPKRHPYNWGEDYTVVPVKTKGWDQRGNPIQVRDKKRSKSYVDAEAAKILGLTRPEASALFAGHNTLADVVQVAVLVADRRGVTLPLPAELAALAVDGRWAPGDDGGFYRTAVRFL